MLAARAVAASPRRHRLRSPTRYRADVDRALGADLRFAALLQHVLRLPIGARAAIRVASLTPWTRRNFARWMLEDYPRAAPAHAPPVAPQDVRTGRGLLPTLVGWPSLTTG